MADELIGSLAQVREAAPTRRRRPRRRREEVELGVTTPSEWRPPLPPRITTPTEARAGLPVHKRLIDIDDITGSRLPAGVVLALADSKLTDEDMRITAMTLARNYDIPPEWLIQPQKKSPYMYDYVDPLTGQSITLASARNIIKPFEEQVIVEMLREASKGVDGQRMIVLPDGVPKLASHHVDEVSPAKIGRIIRAMAPLDGRNLPFETALAAAATFARDPDFSEATFGSNLRYFSELGEEPIHRKGKQYFGPRWTAQRALTFAYHAAAAGITVRSVDEAVSYAFPELAGGIQEAREIQEQKELSTRLGQIREGERAVHMEQNEDGTFTVSVGRKGQEEYEIVAENVDINTAMTEETNAREREHARGLEAASKVIPQTYEEPLGAKALLDEIDRGEQSIAKMGAALRDKIRLDQEQARASVPAKVEGLLAKGAGKVFRGAEIVAADIQGVSVAALSTLAYPLDALGISGQSVGLDYANEVFQTRLADARRIADGRTTLGTELAAEWGLEGAAWAPTLDLTVGLAIDPFIFVGRGVKGVQAARLLWKKRPDQWIEAVDALLNKPVRYRALGRFITLGKGKPLGDMTIPEYLVRQAMSSKDAEQMFVRAVDRFQALWQADGIDPRVASLIFDHVRTTRGAKTVEEVTDDVRAMLAESFGVKLKGHTLNDRLRLAQELVSDQHRDLPLRLPSGARDPKFKPRLGEPSRSGEGVRVDISTQEAFGALEDADLLLASRGAPVHVEIPRFTLTHDLATAVRNSGFANTRYYRGYRAMMNRVPGYWANINDNPDKYIERYMIRSRVFTPQEIAKRRLDMGAIMPGTASERERKFVAMLENTMKETASRIGRTMGIASEDSKRLIDDLNKSVRASNQMLYDNVYGAKVEFDEQGFFSGVVATKPMLSSQLLNEWAIADPLMMRRALADGIGSIRRMRSAVLRGVGREEVPASAMARWSVGKFFRESHDMIVDRAFLSWWKPLAVLRPAYILRVPLFDEQIRYMADLGMIARLESSKWFGNLIQGIRRGSGDLADVWHPFAQVERQIDELAPFVDEVSHQGSIIRTELKAPHTIPEEPLANSGVSGRAIAETLSEESRRIHAAEGGRIVLVEKGKTGYFESLSHALNNAVGRDPLGRMVLRSVTEGRFHDAAVDDIVKFLAEDPVGKRLAVRLGLVNDPDALRAYAEKVDDIIRGYSMNDPALAAAALDQRVTVDALKQFDTADLPAAVHGPSIDFVTSRRYGVSQASVVDTLYKYILQKPTNVLARQPMFRSYYTRTYNAMVALSKEQGIALTEARLARMSQEARTFALTQVRKIMFDFRNQSRFGELFRFAFPFFQPWAEGFEVYTRLARRNPAMLGYGRVVGEWVNDSLPKDPRTGEPVLPMSWFLWAGPLTALTLGTVPGASVYGPLASLNMFVNAAYPLELGKLGSFPLPLPSFSTPYNVALQHLTAGGGVFGFKLSQGWRDALEGWIFQFGDQTNWRDSIAGIFPRYIQDFITATGIAGDRDEKISLANDLLAMYEEQGIIYDDDHPPPTDEWKGREQLYRELGPERKREVWESELQDMALEQAGHVLAQRGLWRFLMPVAPRIKFPTHDMEARWRGLVQKHGRDKAKEIFLSDPETKDNYLVTMAKWAWEQDVSKSPVPIPAGPDINKFLRQPHVQEFALKYPGFVWSIIPKELQNPDYDAGAFFAQVAEGFYRALTPLEFMREAESQKSWDAWFAENERWTAQEEKFSRLYGTTSANYLAAKDRHEQIIADMERMNPRWGREELGTFEKRNVKPEAVASAYRMLEVPMFAATEVGQGLRKYLDLMEEVGTEMDKLGIRSIDTVAAEEFGLTAKWTTGTEQIVKDHPDFERVPYLFFKGALMNRRDPAGKLASKVLQELDPAMIPEWERIQRDWKAMKDVPVLAREDVKSSEGWLAQRRLIDHSFQLFPVLEQNPVYIWWKSKDAREQREYRASMAGRPFHYYSRLDREIVLGMKTNDQAEATWAQVGELELEIQRKQDTDLEWSTVSAHEEVDRFVRAQMAVNPTFRAQVKAANTWGYALEKMLDVSVTDKESDARPYWKALIGTLRTIQSTANRLELHGDDKRGEWIREKRATYRHYRNLLESYVTSLHRASPQFRREWDAVEDANGTDKLIEDLMPIIYFPRGGVYGS